MTSQYDSLQYAKRLEDVGVQRFEASLLGELARFEASLRGEIKKLHWMFATLAVSNLAILAKLFFS